MLVVVVFCRVEFENCMGTYFLPETPALPLSWGRDLEDPKLDTFYLISYGFVRSRVTKNLPIISKSCLSTRSNS